MSSILTSGILTKICDKKEVKYPIKLQVLTTTESKKPGYLKCVFSDGINYIGGVVKKHENMSKNPNSLSIITIDDEDNYTIFPLNKEKIINIVKFSSSSSSS